MFHKLIKVFIPVMAALAVLCAVSCDNSSEPTIPTWAAYVSDGGYYHYHLVQKAQDDTMYVAGINSITRIDNTGKALWQKKINLGQGAVTDRDYWNAFLRETRTGELLLAVSYSSIERLQYKLAVVKITSDGALVWARSYEIPGESSCFFIRGMALDDASGRVIIAGSNATWSDDESSIELMQIDANGDLIWKKKVQGCYLPTHTPMEPSADGGAVIAGYVQTNPEAGIYGTIPCLMKVSAAGSLAWQKTYGASGGADDWEYGYNDERIVAVDRLPDGGYAVAGFANSVMKLDANGNCTWSKAFSAMTPASKLPNSKYSAHAESIIALSDGSIVVAGNSLRRWSYTVPLIWPPAYSEQYLTELHSPWLVKLDAAGKISWKKIYEDATTVREYHSDSFLYMYLTENTLQFYSASAASDGGFAVAGTIKKPATADAGGYALLKVDGSGVIADTDLRVSSASAKLKTFSVSVKDLNCAVEDHTITTNPLSVIVEEASVTVTDI